MNKQKLNRLLEEYKSVQEQRSRCDEQLRRSLFHKEKELARRIYMEKYLRPLIGKKVRACDLEGSERSENLLESGNPTLLKIRRKNVLLKFDNDSSNWIWPGNAVFPLNVDIGEIIKEVPGMIFPLGGFMELLSVTPTQNPLVEY